MERPALWKGVLQNHRILVTAPQVLLLLDALRHGYVNMGTDISLPVFDEAHHAVDNHPYNNQLLHEGVLIQFAHLYSGVPRLLSTCCSRSDCVSNLRCPCCHCVQVNIFPHSTRSFCSNKSTFSEPSKPTLIVSSALRCVMWTSSRVSSTGPYSSTSNIPHPKATI